MLQVMPTLLYLVVQNCHLWLDISTARPFEFWVPYQPSSSWACQWYGSFLLINIGYFQSICWGKTAAWLQTRCELARCLSQVAAFPYSEQWSFLAFCYRLSTSSKVRCENPLSNGSFANQAASVQVLWWLYCISIHSTVEPFKPTFLPSCSVVGSPGTNKKIPQEREERNSCSHFTDNFSVAAPGIK